MSYQNFEIAIYCTVYEIMQMAEMEPVEFQSHFEKLARQVRFSKVYLENFRGGIWVDQSKLTRVKAHFERNGVRASGAIAFVWSDPTDFITSASQESDFVSFCYSRSDQKDTLWKIVQHSAELFDEIIIDDFFFNACRCEACINSKGSQSWSQFRINVMRQISGELVKLAKQVNPAVKLIIKYPNWYDDYQSTGYDLEQQPQLFDAHYTGTETRNSHYTQQTLQRYNGYFLMRYLENVSPGHNAGAWYDTIDCLDNLSSYAEQGYLSLFAKAREVTLFCWGLLDQEGLFPAVAGQVFSVSDQYMAQLGNPYGISCYKPYDSSGENYLHGYLGMLGLPLEPLPRFPDEASTILLTQSAASDMEIMAKIKRHLRGGKNVMLTSGLVKVLQDQGLADITGIRCTDRKVSLSRFGLTMRDASFGDYCEAAAKITLPVLESSTNDCTQVIVGFSAAKSYPVLLRVRYGAGSLLIFAVPDDFSELYHYPAPMLDLVRALLMKDLPVRLEAPGQIGMFLYDNATMIVESFLPYNATATIVVKQDGVKLIDLASQKAIAGEADGAQTRFKIQLRPMTPRLLRY